MYTTESITQAVDQLTHDEKLTLFQLITDHAMLLDKILPGLPLINHVIGKQTLTHPLAEYFNSWSNTKT